MEYGVEAGIPLRVIVDQGEAANAVEVYFPEGEAVAEVKRTAIAGLIGNGSLTRGTENEMTGQHPRIGIARRDTIVVVINAVEHQPTVEQHQLLAFDISLDQPLQLVVIQFQRVSRKPCTRQPQLIFWHVPGLKAAGYEK